MHVLRCFLLLTSLWASVVCSPAHGSVVVPIQVFAMGSVTTPGTLTFVDNTTTWSLTVPASTLTVNGGFTVPPGNTGLAPGDTLSFAGFSDPAIIPESQAAVSTPNFVTFTTTNGNFSFTPTFTDSFTPANASFSTASHATVFIGTLTSSNASFAPTLGLFAFLFNANSTFPNGQFVGTGAEGAAWVLFSFAPPVPEPASLSVWSLMAIGMLAYRSRSNRSGN